MANTLPRASFEEWIYFMENILPEYRIQLNQNCWRIRHYWEV